MSILQNMKLSNVQRSSRLTPVQHRRHKLVNRLHEQLMLAQAIAEGKAFEIPIVRRFKDSETGQIKRIEGTRPVREWWFVDEAGKLMMQVKYGSKVIQLMKGKCSIEVGERGKLIPTIELLKKAALDGEFDGQIEAVIK